MVILVTEDDREIGIVEKLTCHIQGSLHRAVSISVSDGNGNILLQQRASGKYHSAALWSNTCCTHPRPGEAPIIAAKRRMLEELGLDCALHFSRTLRYSAQVGRGMIENEFVHLFTGVCQGPIYPNPLEVQACKWVSREQLDDLLKREPWAFTAWFKSYVAMGAI